VLGAAGGGHHVFERAVFGGGAVRHEAEASPAAYHGEEVVELVDYAGGVEAERFDAFGPAGLGEGELVPEVPEKTSVTPMVLPAGSARRDALAWSGPLSGAFGNSTGNEAVSTAAGDEKRASMREST